MKTTQLRNLIREEIRRVIKEAALPKKWKSLTGLEKYFFPAEIDTIEKIWGSNTTRVVLDKFNKPYWVKYVYKSAYNKYLEFKPTKEVSPGRYAP